MTTIDKIAPIAEATHGPLVVAPIYDGLCTFEFSIVAEVFGLARPETVSYTHLTLPTILLV